MSSEINSRVGKWQLSLTKRMEILRLAHPDMLSNVLGREVNLGEITHMEHANLVNVFREQDRFSPGSRDHIIGIGSGFEHGWQDSRNAVDNKLYYLRFYDLFMADFDSSSLDDVLSACRSLELTFRIYRTPRGYHVFATSRKINYRDSLSINLPNSDAFYRAFSYKCGYKVRISHKLDETAKVAEYVERVGEYPEDPELLELLALHDLLIEAN